MLHGKALARPFSVHSISIFPSILKCPTKFFLAELFAVDLDPVHSIELPLDRADLTGLLAAAVVVVVNFVVAVAVANFADVVAAASKWSIGYTAIGYS